MGYYGPPWRGEASLVYSGTSPRGLEVRVNVGSVRVEYSPSAGNATVLLEQRGHCSIVESSYSQGVLRVAVECRGVWLLGGSSRGVLLVTLPSHTIDWVRVEVSVGRVVIEGLEAGSLEVVVDTGSIELRGVGVARELAASVDVGSIEAKGLELASKAQASLSARVGSIDLGLANTGIHISSKASSTTSSVVEVRGCQEAPSPLLEVSVDVGSARISCRTTP